MTRILLIALTLLPSALFAEPINVRTAMHEDFRRLVLDTNSSRAWRMDIDGSSSRIRLPGHRDGFDIDGVYRRIDRTVIRNITSQDDALLLDLACDCSVSVFPNGPDMLVVDIKVNENEIASTPSGEPLVDTAGSAPPIPVLPDEEERYAVLRPEETTAPILPTREFHSQLLNPFIKRMSAESAIERTNIEVADEEIQTSLSDFEAALAMQLGLAATQGILTPQMQEPEKEEELDPFVEGVTNEIPQEFQNIVISPATPQIDDAIEGSEEFGLDPSCGIDEHFDVASWMSAEVDFSIISEFRAQIYREFDSVDNTAVLNLARAYIYFGFGIEANEAALLADENTDALDAAILISNIISGNRLNGKSKKMLPKNCLGSISLWSILFNPDYAPNQKTTESALKTLSNLPVSVREFVAPALADVFTLNGDEESARSALRSLSRRDYNRSPKEVLSLAKSLDQSDNSQQVEELLNEVVATNTEEAALALLKSVRRNVELGKYISKDTFTLIDSYRVILRNNEISDDLSDAQVMAYLSNNDFYKALDFLAEVGSGKFDLLIENIYQKIASNASDIDFVNIVLQNQEDISELTQSTKLEILDRILSLGFKSSLKPELASEILESQFDTHERQTTLDDQELSSEPSLNSGTTEAFPIESSQNNGPLSFSAKSIVSATEIANSSKELLSSLSAINTASLLEEEIGSE